MTPALLFLLGGGAAAAVAAVAASGGPSEGAPPTPPSGPGPTGDLRARMAARGYPWTENVEKFADPRIAACYAEAGGPYAIRGQALILGADDGGLGLSYLNATPARARPRIAAIRARVDRFGGFNSPIVASMADGSAVALRSAALDLRAKLANPVGRAKLAEAIGIPLAQWADAEAAFESAVNSATRKYIRLDVSSLFADLKTALGGALGQAFASFARAIVDAIGGAKAAADAASALADVGSAVSTIMPILKLVLDTGIKVQADREKEWAALCQEYSEAELFAPLRSTVALGFPPAWHAIDVWAPACAAPSFGGATRWTPTASQEGAARDAKDALAQARALGVNLAAVDVRRWWTTAVLFASDPVAERCLRALGRQRGLWASDEHVVLVGVPIALAFGLDPWAFCEALWGFSWGWWQYRKLGTGTCSKPPGAPATWATDVPADRRILNAWILSLAGCASAAFALAEELSKGAKLGSAVGQLELRAMVPR